MLTEKQIEYLLRLLENERSSIYQNNPIPTQYSVTELNINRNTEAQLKELL
jgi:hypothetical protein